MHLYKEIHDIKFYRAVEIGNISNFNLPRIQSIRGCSEGSEFANPVLTHLPLLKKTFERKREGLAWSRFFEMWSFHRTKYCEEETARTSPISGRCRKHQCLLAVMLKLSRIASNNTMGLLKFMYTHSAHCQEAIVLILRLILPVLQSHSPVSFPSIEPVFTRAGFTNRFLCFFAKKETQLFPTALNTHTHFPMTSDP